MTQTKAASVSLDDAAMKLGATDVQRALEILVARVSALEAENATLRAFVGLDFEGPDATGNIPAL